MLQRPAFHLAVALSALVVAAPASTRAEDAAPPARAVVVLDSSGSMLNPIEAFKKYYWVRKSLQTQMATPPTGLDAGLVSYGHRLRNTCNDVELLRPVEPFDAGRFLSTVASVRPHGQTPVSDALKAAAEALGKGGGKVLLIAGSADSCQQDPCATAKDLAAAEPGLAIDVLSIGVSEADARQMACIAEGGRGQVFAATTMADSPKAFADAFAALTAPPSIAAPPPAPAAPAAASGLNLSARLTNGGPLSGLPVAWTVRKIEGGKPGAVVFRAAAPTATTPLPPGSYDVEAASGAVDVHQPVEIAASAATDAAINLNAAGLRLRLAPAKPGEATGEVFYTVYRSTSNPDDETPDATIAMLRDPVANPLLLPAGTYRIAASRGTVRQEKRIDLAAGQEQPADFALTSGKLVIEAEAAASAGSGSPIYFISEDDPDQPLGRRDVAQSAIANPAFDLPPGVYHVSTRQGAGKVRLDAVVKTGEVTKLTVPLSMGRLRLETQGLAAGPALPEDLISYTVERLDEAGKPQSMAARSSSSLADIELEAGQYRVTGRIGLVNVSASADVAVRAGAETRSVLAQQAGLLDLSFGDDPAAAVDVLWEIRDAGGKSLWSTTVPAPLVPLAPGNYTVRASRLGKDKSVEVTIAPGERKAVAIRPD